MIFPNLPYLSWLTTFVFIPSAIVWLIFWKYLIKFKKTFIFVTAFSLLWGLLFDIVGSSHWHIWYYTHNLNIYLLGLPLEEYLILLFLPQQITAIFLLIRKIFPNE
jgi:hypothetical protein